MEKRAGACPASLPTTDSIVAGLCAQARHGRAAARHAHTCDVHKRARRRHAGRAACLSASRPAHGRAPSARRPRAVRVRSRSATPSRADCVSSSPHAASSRARAFVKAFAPARRALGRMRSSFCWALARSSSCCLTTRSPTSLRRA
eukprot:793785-Prymnesium_polylepis.2